MAKQAQHVEQPPEPPRLLPKIPIPSEAIAIVRDEEKKWVVVHLKLVEGLICDARVVEKSHHLDIAQDAARRAVLGLRG